MEPEERFYIILAIVVAVRSTSLVMAKAMVSIPATNIELGSSARRRRQKPGFLPGLFGGAGPRRDGYGAYRVRHGGAAGLPTYGAEEAGSEGDEAGSEGDEAGSEGDEDAKYEDN
ncbi:hypothetical protein MY11210_008435 [Beauveria gryllotalpidicola]